MQNTNVITKLRSEAEGWLQLSLNRKCDGLFFLFKRKSSLSELLHHNHPHNIFAEITTKSAECLDMNEANENSKTLENQGISVLPSEQKNAESNHTMGTPRVTFDPERDILPCLSNFEEFESLRNLRTDKPSIVIGFDAEWYGEPRRLISWQFVVIHETFLHEYVFIKRNFDYAGVDDDLWLELALGRILDDLGCKPYRSNDYYEYQYISCLNEKTKRPDVCKCATYKEAKDQSKYAFIDGKPSDILISDLKTKRVKLNPGSEYKPCLRSCNVPSAEKINITLVGHASKVDLTTLMQDRKTRVNILRHLTEAQGGVFTMYPICFKANRVIYSDDYCYPISLSVRDSMCSAPAGGKALSSLGSVIGIPKVELPEGCIEHMDILWKTDPALYLEYASTDAVIAMLYTSAIYGYNCEQAGTILSAGTGVMAKTISDYLGVDDKDNFNRQYRGLVSVKKGKLKSTNGPGYIDATSLEPLNRDACILQKDASEAYHGGYNGCSDVGFFDTESYDYDLQNAYPTAMCLVPDVDWKNCILFEFENDHVLCMEDFRIGDTNKYDVFPMMFGYVEFEFPENVKYPCIPVNVEGNLIYPRTSKGLDGVYACGPELYLAVALGAKVIVKKGYVVNTLYHGDRSVSYSLKQCVKQLVVDRRKAKSLCGKGSIEELVLKLLVNGGYGKTAQNVVQKSHWSAYSEEMEDIGCSRITNPVSACMITSIVRAVLIAAQNQATDLGYTTYSVTTDGFISDIPEDVLKSLDLFGLRAKLGEARLFLTDGEDSEIWEIKHIQNDLLNFTTRGNVSINTGKKPSEIPSHIPSEQADRYYYKPVYNKPGVCAHNSSKSGYLSDSYDDRLWLMTRVLSRVSTVDYEDSEWPNLKDMINGMPFMVRKVTRHIHMDFDMKRKPLRSSFATVYPCVEGNQYEIENFTTVPFDTVEEYLDYRKAKSACVCLRSDGDWNHFWKRIDLKGCGAKPRDLDWSKLNSVIMGHRCGLWTIEVLNDPDMTVQDKCDWINKFNKSSKTFKPSDWKNAGKPARHHSILPQHLLSELLFDMQNSTRGRIYREGEVVSVVCLPMFQVQH